MLISAMHPFASRRSVFAACILAIGAMAADPDGGTDAAAAQDGSADAASAADATTATPDATVTTPTDASGEAAGEDGAAAAEAGGGVQYVQPDGALPPYSAGNVYDLLCVPDPGVTFFAFDTVKPPYADVAGCMAFKRSGHTAAYDCFCQNCFSLQQQCDALPGCQAIQKCELDIGCTNANSCYLGGGPCVAPINNYGTGSVSTALTQLIATCGSGASPACPHQ
jgi:hypothetical protein